MSVGLKEGFRKYLEEAIGHENASVAFSALDGPASVSVRLNPGKDMPGTRQWAGIVPWSPYGRYLSERPVFTLDPFFHGGSASEAESSEKGRS